MVVEAQRLPVESVARAAAEVAASSDLRTALDAIARAAAEATGADVAVVRVLDADGHLATRALAPEGSSLAPRDVSSAPLSSSGSAMTSTTTTGLSQI